MIDNAVRRARANLSLVVPVRDPAHTDLAEWNSHAELPFVDEVIVVQPADADLVQGTISLHEFEHPDEAVYIFGGSQTRLNQSDVRNALAEFVFIQVGDLFPSQAGAIVLWDRIWKRGGRP